MSGQNLTDTQLKELIDNFIKKIEIYKTKTQHDYELSTLAKAKPFLEETKASIVDDFDIELIKSHDNRNSGFVRHEIHGILSEPMQNEFCSVTYEYSKRYDLIPQDTLEIIEEITPGIQ